jgi:hypothetical protein
MGEGGTLLYHGNLIGCIQRISEKAKVKLRHLCVCIKLTKWKKGGYYYNTGISTLIFM